MVPNIKYLSSFGFIIICSALDVGGDGVGNPPPHFLNVSAKIFSLRVWEIFFCCQAVADPGGVRPHPPSDLILFFFLTIFLRTHVFLYHPHPPSGSSFSFLAIFLRKFVFLFHPHPPSKISGSAPAVRCLSILTNKVEYRFIVKTISRIWQIMPNIHSV
jgi:hypothetical protein